VPFLTIIFAIYTYRKVTHVEISKKKYVIIDESSDTCILILTKIESLSILRGKKISSIRTNFILINSHI
jgi:hypothetical protein